MCIGHIPAQIRLKFYTFINREQRLGQLEANVVARVALCYVDVLSYISALYQVCKSQVKHAVFVNP